jgi:uncharacterized protein YeaO (DUF488 family)
MAKISLKRAYEAAQPSDGFRVLVDRLWPRGVTKEAAAVDLWLKSVAPSAELRKWFGHDPEKFDEFRARYFKELEQPDAVAALADLRGTEGVLTLLTASQAVAISQAAVLADVLGG